MAPAARFEAHPALRIAGRQDDAAPFPARRLAEREPVLAAAQRDVDDRDVERLGVERGAHFRAVARQREFVPGMVEHVAEQRAHRIVVLDDKNVADASHRSRYPIVDFRRTGTGSKGFGKIRPGRSDWTVSSRQAPPRVPPLPADAPTLSHRDRRGQAARHESHARQSCRLRERGSGRRRSRSKAGAR